MDEHGTEKRETHIIMKRYDKRDATTGREQQTNIRKYLQI